MERAIGGAPAFDESRARGAGRREICFYISQGVSKEIVSSTPTPLMKLNRRPAATGESLFTLRAEVHSISGVKIKLDFFPF